MNQEYRRLSENEISQLKENKCFCDDWNLIEVKEQFNPDSIINVKFSGSVRLGIYNKSFDNNIGIKRHSGIYNATIHNCEIGDNVFIKDIHNCIANYRIGDHVVINDINTLAVSGRTSFGNGVQVAVLDETGSRNITIYDKLSSQIAYIYTFYRYNESLIERLETLIKNYIQERSARYGFIDRYVRIENCGSLTNITVNGYSIIEGVPKLNNGTIGENTYLGHNVLAEDFIILSDSHISSGARISRCFVGQGCKICNGFSATDSLFFANCHMENGEACALFAGPFTVSHHKSTLLIGAYFSFMNAGSGSNQSNHMYKSGPVHYGIGERGVKLASDSYLMWPAIIGAYTMVMGRHCTHSDTGSFPFSYLIENNGESYLAPAVNLATMGTIRDVKKWQNRDKRKSVNKLDILSFDMLNPYICQKIKKALLLLADIVDEQSDKEIYNYGGVKITNRALAKGIKYYNLILDKYYGDTYIGNENVSNDFSEGGLGDWVDIGGYIVPKWEIDKILSDFPNLDALTKNLANLFSKIKIMEWNWVAYQLKELQRDEILKRWIEASRTLNELKIKDASKEFSDTIKIVYGLDGSIDNAKFEFEKMRGTLDNSTFIQEIEEQMKEDEATYNRLI